MSFSVLAAAREVGDALALDTPSGSLTYRALAAKVEDAMRARAGTPLVALSPRADLQSLVSLLACIEAGIPFVPIHPRATDAERVSLSETIAEIEPSALGPAPLAVLFTSGTSGRPKGAILSRRAFEASVAASARRVALGPGDRWLLSLPPAHVGGISLVLRAIAARATVVLGDERGRFDPRSVAEELVARRITHASLVPTMLHRLLGLPEGFDARALSTILLGGAAADPSTLEEARRRGLPVQWTYGLTEACSQVATSAPGDLAAGKRGALPLDGVSVCIRDGVIAVRGPNLFDGYVGISREQVFDDEGFFSTGDLGRIDTEGRLHVEGRRSDLIVSGGENVYPAEVESAILASPDVVSACVFGVPDPEWGERVAVALVLASGADEAAGVRACHEASSRLAPFKLPRAYAVLDALPTRGIGKLDRRATAALATPRLTRLSRS